MLLLFRHSFRVLDFKRKNVVWSIRHFSFVLSFLADGFNVSLSGKKIGIILKIERYQARTKIYIYGNEFDIRALVIRQTFTTNNSTSPWKHQRKLCFGPCCVFSYFIMISRRYKHKLKNSKAFSVGFQLILFFTL